MSTPGSLAAAWRHRYARWGVIAAPFLWMLLFFAVPFAIVVKISLASKAIAMPPFTDLIEYSGGIAEITFKLSNYFFLIEEAVYYQACLNAIRIAFISAVCALLIGYPIAWFIAQARQPLRNILLVLVIMPSWTSFLIRIYAWIGILKNNGLVNNALAGLGVIDPLAPLQLLHTEFATCVGIVYAYLPFMILPLYAVLEKQDKRLLEAAADLGATPWVAFFRITLPLSMPGVVCGCMLVFIPALGEFVIPELLGGSQTIVIGKVLWQEFFNNRDWPIASAVATVMLVLILVPVVLFHRYQAQQLEARTP